MIATYIPDRMEGFLLPIERPHGFFFHAARRKRKDFYSSRSGSLAGRDKALAARRCSTGSCTTCATRPG
jgi:hypothetical protein